MVCTVFYDYLQWQGTPEVALAKILHGSSCLGMYYIIILGKDFCHKILILRTLH
jgi:hypothetical protein